MAETEVQKWATSRARSLVSQLTKLHAGVGLTKREATTDRTSRGWKEDLPVC
jgi:hypothetical protein